MVRRHRLFDASHQTTYGARRRGRRSARPDLRAALTALATETCAVLNAASPVHPSSLARLVLGGLQCAAIPDTRDSIDQVFAADPAMRGCLPILASPGRPRPGWPRGWVRVFGSIPVRRFEHAPGSRTRL